MLINSISHNPAIASIDQQPQEKPTAFKNQLDKTLVEKNSSLDKLLALYKEWTNKIDPEEPIFPSDNNEAIFKRLKPTEAFCFSLGK